MPLYMTRPVPPWDAADHPGYIAGGTYPLCRTQTASAAPAAANLVYLFPWMPEAPVVPASFGLRVTTGGAASSFKLGVWRNNPATMRPTGLPFMSNNTDNATTGTSVDVLATVAGVPLAPGVLTWVGAVFTGTLPTVCMIGNTTFETTWLLGLGIGNAVGSNITGLSTPHTYATDIATLDMTGAVFTNVTSNAIPIYLMRV